MDDEHGQDEVFELTEEMATPSNEESAPSPQPAANGNGNGNSAASDSSSGPVTDGKKPRSPSPSSPFLLLADPKPADKKSDRPTPDPTKAKRTSFTPSNDGEPVVVYPIHNVGEGKDGDDVPGTEQPSTDSNAPPKPPSALKPKARAETRSSTPPAPPQGDDGNGQVVQGDDNETTDEILDLKQEFVVKAGSSSTPPAADQAEPEAVVVTSDDSAAEGTDAAGSGAEGSGTGPDYGTPEMVFDMSAGEAQKTAVELARDDEAEDEPEELDLEGAEEITTSHPPKAPPAGSIAKGTSGRHPRMQRRRKKRSEWWTEIFNDDYLALLPKYTARDLRREVDFIEKTLEAPQGSLILDLACGQGSQAVGMARRGYRVVGVDLSLAMLARAGEQAQEEGQKINFIHGDMCDLGFNQTFDAVYCIGTSFGYFDDNTNAKVLDGVYKALKPGGRFLLSVTNRDHAVVDQPNLTWFEGRAGVCMEETDFNYINSRLYLTRQIIMNEDGRQSKHEFSVRLYSLHELGVLLHNAGFKVTRVAGHPSTPGAFFGVDSAQLIITSERRA